MRTLPLLISVPHAGTTVPPEVSALCRLNREQIIADGDVGAAEIYAFRNRVGHFFTTDIARVIIDLNRAPKDRSRGGFIIRSHCRRMPWVQLEISRAPFMSNGEKREAVLSALTEWARRNSR